MKKILLLLFLLIPFLSFSQWTANFSNKCDSPDNWLSVTLVSGKQGAFILYNSSLFQKPYLATGIKQVSVSKLPDSLKDFNFVQMKFPDLDNQDYVFCYGALNGVAVGFLVNDGSINNPLVKPIPLYRDSEYKKPVSSSGFDLSSLAPLLKLLF